MKKILLLLLALGLILGLSACDRTEETPYEPELPPVEEPMYEEPDLELEMEYDPYEEEGFGYALRPTHGTAAEVNTIASLEMLGLSIVRLTEENDHLAPMVMHNFFYNFMVEARGADMPSISGDNLLIMASVPLYDFSIIAIDNDVIDDEIVFIPVATLDQVDLLLGEGYLISNFIWGGTMPQSAITFLDANGYRFYFAIVQNQAYPNEGGAYMLIQFANRTEELPAN